MLHLVTEEQAVNPFDDAPDIMEPGEVAIVGHVVEVKLLVAMAQFALTAGASLFIAVGALDGAEDMGDDLAGIAAALAEVKR